MIHAALPHLGDGALVHTITHGPDLDDLAGRVGRPRVVVEGLSSMNRHGIPADWMQQTLDALAPCDLLALSLHLPLGSGHVAEVRRWVDRFAVPEWQLSHVTPAEQGELRAAYPDHTFRVRIGTQLWLGDPQACRRHGPRPRRPARVDRRPGRLPDASGCGRAGCSWSSGGTAQGVALEAPSGADTMRHRAVALAEGALEAAGRIRSPFQVGGHTTWFVEPPHMQVSLVMLPEGSTPPEVGDGGRRAGAQHHAARRRVVLE